MYAHDDVTHVHVVVVGVTILTVTPNTANMSTSPVDTEPFTGNEAAVRTRRQDEVGVAWEKPPPEEHIDGVCECSCSYLLTSRPYA